jgi:micrococcal nuclease
MGDIRRLHQLMPFPSEFLGEPELEVPEEKGKHPLDSAWIPIFAFVLAAALTAVVLTDARLFAVSFASAVPRTIEFKPCVYVAQPNCVIDGDTFRTETETVRLADITTPEIFTSACPLEQQRGEAAMRRLTALLSAGPFALVETGPDEDEFGHKLRLVTRGGESLGATMVAEGLARERDGANGGWC